MVRRIQIEHVDEYLRCPLFYRYRRELDLPINGTEDLLFKSAKRAVSAWFHALGKGLDRKKARAKVGRSLKHLWTKDGGNEDGFPLAHARIMAILLALDSNFNQKIDSPIDGGLKISAALSGSLFEDVIDGLYLKNDLKPGVKREDKTLVAIQIIKKDGLLSSRAIQMRKAMIRYAINSAMKPNPYKIKLLQVMIPDCTRSWYDLDKHAYDEFLFLGRAIVRHLDGKNYLPTAHPNDCKVCPYEGICSNHFCEPEVSSQLVDRARLKLGRQSD